MQNSAEFVWYFWQNLAISVRGHAQISLRVTCDIDKWQRKARTFECQCLPGGENGLTECGLSYWSRRSQFDMEAAGESKFYNLPANGGPAERGHLGGRLNRRLAPTGNSDRRPSRAPFIIDGRSLHVCDEYLLIWLGRKHFWVRRNRLEAAAGPLSTSSILDCRAWTPEIYWCMTRQYARKGNCGW